jgi:hypothetical protein
MDNEEFHTELRSGSNKNAHGIRKAISQRSGSRAPLHESDCGTRRGQEKHSRWIGVWRTQGHYRPVACDEGPIAVRPAIRFGARLDDRVTDEINEANVKLSRVDENERDYDYLAPVSGLKLIPGNDCEPIKLEFDSDLYVQEWTKTQFAGAEIHLTVCDSSMRLNPISRPLK